MKLTWLRDVSEDFGIDNFGQLFHVQIEEDRGQEFSRLVLRFDQNVLRNSQFVKLRNGLLYYRQPFHNPTSVEHLGLDCKVEYTSANQGIMPEAHTIWIQYTQREENDLDNTFQGRIPSFPVFFCSWTAPDQVLHFQHCLPAAESLSTLSKRCKKSQQSVLLPEAHDYTLVIRTMYKDLHGWAECVDRFIRVFKETSKIHIVPVGAIVGLAHLVQENAALDGIDSV